MRPVPALLLALLAASPIQAQPFPAPGTGVFTWQRIGDRPLDAKSFAFAPDGRLYSGFLDTLFVLGPPEDDAPTGRWQPMGYPRGVIDALLVLDAAADSLIVANGNGSQIVRSTTGGAPWSWPVVHGGIGGVVGGPKAPDGFYVVPPGHPQAGRLLAGGTILHSDDRGATWREARRIPPFPGDGGYAHLFAALPSGRLLIAGNWGVAASDDGGTSVAVTPIWGDYRFLVDGLAALATPGSAQTGAPACGLPQPALCDGAIAIGIDATLPDVRAWRTNDGGRSWEPAVPLLEPFDGAASAYVVGVVDLGPGENGLGRAITVLGRGMLYATADGGQSWDLIGRLPVRLGGGSHFPRLVRLGPDGHLWVTTTINGPEPEWIYRSLEPAVTAFGVATAPTPEPTGAVRLAVHPNPAGATATVTVEVAAPVPHAVASVYDALGRRIAVLHDGPLSAGLHDFTLDVSALAPGVYLVRLDEGRTTHTARLTTIGR